MADQEKTLARTQRYAAVGVVVAASCLFGYGVAGSYRSIERLAAVHHVPLAALVPVGIDGGLVGAVLLDIVLTWTGYPVWWLSRSLTLGTIAANGAAGWPDPVATGLHPAAPVMILAVIEATQSVLLHRTPSAIAERREPVPLARWLLAPWPTWMLWRRMVLWQVTSYRDALETEQRQLRAFHQLRRRYGANWAEQVPDDLAWMLRDGVMIEDAIRMASELASEVPPEGSGLAERGMRGDRTDAELAADMRTRWPVRRPSREDVRTTYRIGSTRASRLLHNWNAAQPQADRQAEVA